MAATSELIVIVVTILGLGVAAQVIADRLRVPSVMFLILAGIAVGPEGLGVITPAVFGDGLPAIVGLSVAIIVFEGAFHLNFERLREAPRETFRLVTIGAVISLIGTATVVRFALDASWSVAFLIGSLLIATGPTVITPIMNVVPVRNRVATTLETEGVVNDVTAAILAFVMFEFVLLETQGFPTLIREFGMRLGGGILVGSVVAGIVWYLLRHVSLSVENAPQNARLIVLVASLVMYGIAEIVAPEAGIAAVATGGFTLGNAEIPYRGDIERFKGDITLLVISFVFITLASLLSLRDILSLGIGGVVVVIVVAGVIRPALVILCTVGDRLTFDERLYISAIGPRGIIPASVATLFALELQSQNPQAATMLVGTVFLVIVSTVVFEGGLARHIAQALDVIPMRTLIIGGGRVGQALTERLEERDEEVLIIDNDDQTVETLRADGFSVRHGDGTQQEVLESAGANNARVVAAATGTDDVNLLVAQLAKNTFGVERVVARVNQPGNIDAFEDLDIEPISTGMSVAWSMDNVIERPAISRWMTELGRTGDVQEIEVTNVAIVGETISELMAELPEDCHLALLSRDETNQLPHPEDTIERGDHLTFIGRTEAVRQAIDHCTG
ncbi:sodium/proton antiporter, CPA1 family protein [Halogeometricum borinquense DSM 11551]|uniref:Sodium/proton antiporter, CPA1 family n=2 Tax=Halogeometricum borinquense TaxID=60847 RepID=E4NU82_HALBP|nr:cation:proton antiporter [Halogeometricum borinquense]ADQ68602.1 sodium/proton antiporter, CPA1 family [Halogeometricum borinquense DSM 11551]ELY25527.1 sodium/proton antiporter, CPA1 family protein [Halogeometricum borinquense DSM 11551]RYJ08583.1 potassium transporter [Halogeometricum borinquense]